MASFSVLKQSGRSSTTMLLNKQMRGLASSTAPRFAPATVTVHHEGGGSGGLRSRLPAYGPMWGVIGIMGGLAVIPVLIGLHSLKQQLFHNPSVQVTKTKRSTIPEVENPDAVVQSADKFNNKSFLRKVAHIQDNKHAHNDPTRPDPFTRSRDVETLKSVGVRTRS